MEILQPLGLVALITGPFIVALYFLRQRHPPRQVGSLMLWRRAQSRVFRGRPWEKFRPSWLLLLQLIAAALIALALARPACVISGVDVERMVIILDASASMGATDASPSRWAAAIDKARETVETAPRGSEIAILRAGHITRVVEPFTQDLARLDRRLAELRDLPPDATSASIKEALLLALQLQHPDGGDAPPGALVLFSDGAFDTGDLPALGGRLTYVGVGQRADNLALTTFEPRQAMNQRFESSVIATVTNTGPSVLAGHLDVSLNGSTLEAHSVRLEPGRARTFSIPVASDRGELVATLKEIRDPDGGDARDLLAADNVAYAVIAPARPLRVLLVGGNPLLERALRVNAQLEVDLIGASDFVGASDYDVVVFENTFPATIPQGRFLVFGPPTGGPLLDNTGEVFDAPKVATWDRGHPSLFHVELGQVRFTQTSRAVPTRSLIPLVEFGGDAGPLLLAGQTPSWRGLVWTAELMESDFPLQVSFPVFLYNAIGWLSPGADQAPGHTLSTGQSLPLRAQSGDLLEIALPQGQTTRRTVTNPRPGGVVLFTDTAQPGFYAATVTPADDTKAREQTIYGVSMTHPLESNITPKSKLTLPRGGEVVLQDQARHVAEWLPHLLLALFFLLAAEWWFHLRQTRGGG